MFQCCCAEAEPKEMHFSEEFFNEAQSVMPALGKEDHEEALSVKEDGSSWPVRFHVNVERTTTSFLGMDLSAAGPVLMVSSIAATESLIGAWNVSCDTTQRVDKYDRLVSVNGYMGAKGKDTLEKLKVSQGQLVLVFERPSVFEVEFEVSKAEELGLVVSTGPSFILISSVEEGLVQQHNTRAPKEQQIKLGTRVLEVNGQPGSGANLESLVKALAGKTKLKFVTWSC
eukprot:TRINITY_DN80910_c0_g1_i1.p1 TRINITY_DN80910_c0_g1~~TRINITY_DN80910_c0_g1_i1.p1  ORF type:complete len:228 (-),score=59.09 TRINITY_DN80910_c0_g1_i1:95-778(-)